jgi:RNA polymerase sigma factor (sigma-70 family)
MEDKEDRWERMLQGLRAGDGRCEREFWEQYGEALQRLADRHLGPGLRARVGPEDVVQSACRTFLRRARIGEFQLADSADLWRVLCAITLTKTREQARFHLRKKRGLDQEVPLAAASDTSSGGRELIDPAPSPDEVAEFADQFQQLLAGLDEEERQVVVLKLEECTNDEIAERLGSSERTVRRILKRVQSRLTRTLEAN